jgi:hypothetical protein
MGEKACRLFELGLAAIAGTPSLDISGSMGDDVV